MTIGAAIAAALLLLVQVSGDAAPPPAQTPAFTAFAPPTGRPMTYRVTARRLARDGTMVSYTLVYALQWSRVGRGIRLAATLRDIESDGRPELAQAFSGLFQPLVGQEMTYLVAPDGSSIDLVDPEAAWARVLAHIQRMGETSDRPEAKQLAKLLAALPPTERDRLIASDIRAFVAPANTDLLAAATQGGTGDEGGLRTLAVSERTEVPTGTGARPVEIITAWRVDPATGLVASERRQSWLVGDPGGTRTLVEERLRALDPVAN